MKSLKERIKDKFNYDVSALPAYIDEQSEEIIQDLLFESGFTSRINVLENVKGKQTIKLLNADMALQSVTNCTMSDDGTITFDGKDIETKRLGIQASICNEDLEQTWAQMLLAVGANRQDREMPYEAVMLAYITKLIKNKNQNLIFNGDTASLNTDLVHYDGLVKQWNADADLVVASSTETAITSANAFDLAREVYYAIPTVLFDNGTNVEIITGRDTAEKIIAQVYNDKDFASSIDVTYDGSEMYFTLPTTGITVRSYSQLNGQEVMFAVPYNYIFFGTDVNNDFDGVSVKYLEDDEKLRITNKMRSGIQYVYPEYFVRLELTTA